MQKACYIFLIPFNSEYPTMTDSEFFCLWAAESSHFLHEKGAPCVDTQEGNFIAFHVWGIAYVTKI